MWHGAIFSAFSAYDRVMSCQSIATREGGTGGTCVAVPSTLRVFHAGFRERARNTENEVGILFKRRNISSMISLGSKNSCKGSKLFALSKTLRDSEHTSVWWSWLSAHSGVKECSPLEQRLLNPNRCAWITGQASGGASSPCLPFFLVLFHFPPLSSGSGGGGVGFGTTPICLSLVSNTSMSRRYETLAAIQVGEASLLNGVRVLRLGLTLSVGNWARSVQSSTKQVESGLHPSKPAPRRSSCELQKPWGQCCSARLQSPNLLLTCTPLGSRSCDRR